MNGNEIIKAFEHLVKNANNHIPITGKLLLEDVLTVLNRQKEQIKKLENIERVATKTIEKQQEEIERYLHSIKLLEKDVQTAKSKAIKEFAEKVDKILCLQIGPSKRAFWKITEDIKNLVKEMVGDDNA